MKTLAYLRTEIGDFALTHPVSKPGMKDKNLLVRMSRATARKVEAEFKDAVAKCVETKTGARLCVFSFDKTELEGIEMCRPTYTFKTLIELKEHPSLEECIKKKKNDFLVVGCAPESACGLKDGRRAKE
jgi:hypothetical protein